MTARGTARPRDLKKGPAMTVPRTNTGRERAGSEAEPDRRPVTAAAGGHARRAALPRRAGFWLAAGILFLLLFGAAAPSPLYGVYQAQWRVSATTLAARLPRHAPGPPVTVLVFRLLLGYLGRPPRLQWAPRAGRGAVGGFLAARGGGP